MGIVWIERLQWGAGPVTLGVAAPHEQFRRLTIHHTVAPCYGTDVATVVAYMKRLQTSRPDLGLEVPYSFVVFEGPTPEDAYIAVGRGWCRTGAHTAGYNSTTYGVALAGDYTDRAPSPGQLAAIREIGRHITDPEPTWGHRDSYATACPGDSAYPLLDQLQPPFDIEEDMALSADDIERIWSYPIQTRRGVFPVRAVLGWLKDEVTEPDLLLARIDASDDDERPTFVGEGASAAEVADELAARLAQ